MKKLVLFATATMLTMLFSTKVQSSTIPLAPELSSEFLEDINSMNDELNQYLKNNDEEIVWEIISDLYDIYAEEFGKQLLSENESNKKALEVVNRIQKIGEEAQEECWKFTFPGLDIKYYPSILEEIYNYTSEMGYELSSVNIINDKGFEVTVQNNNYQIRKGDKLSCIAYSFETSIDKLIEINNISNPDLIYAGETLRIE